MVTENLKQYIDFKGISIYEIENKLSVGRGTISKSIKENKSIGSKIVENILTIYPDINTDWLFSGRGSMLKSESKEKNQIPLYDTLAIGGKQLTANMDAVNEPIELIDAGDWFKNATGAITVHGNSMETKYCSGCIVVFKEVLDKELIVPGRDYVIETTEYRILKRIQKNSSKDFVLACSYNEEQDIMGNVIHAPFEVPLKKISRLFEVLGKVEQEVSSPIMYNRTKKSTPK